MLKVAIIGAGFMGQTHAGIYRSMQDVKLVAILDKDEKKAKEFAKNNECKYFDELSKLCTEEKLDFIDICLPTFLHEEYIIKASEFVKYIICEKPITLSMSSLERIIESIEKNGAKLYLGQVLRFWEEYVNAKKIYEKGELGSLKYIEAKRLSEAPSWSAWYKKAENSGGGLFDLHLHDIDFLIYLLGKPLSVYASGIKDENNAWNFVNTSMNFKNNIIASIQGVINMSENYPFTMKLCMVGNEATYEYEMRAGKNLENMAEALKYSKIYSKNGIKNIKVEDNEAYRVELEHFVHCIQEDRESEIIGIGDIKDTMLVMEAIKKSLETKEIIMLGE